jgi:hypothetical protein
MIGHRLAGFIGMVPRFGIGIGVVRMVLGSGAAPRALPAPAAPPDTGLF